MKIKTFFLIVCALTLFFTGCEKDEFFSDSDNAVLKSAAVKEVPIKMVVGYVVVTNADQPEAPPEGICYGILTHLGKLQAEKSTWYTSGVITPDTENPGLLLWPQEGEWCAANGDLLHWTIETHLDPMNFTVYGTAIFNGGTGRFATATGYFDLNGHIDPDNVTRFIVDEGIGEISNVGSSK